MEQAFKFIIDTRKVFIRLIDSLSLEQLNKVPEGFNNNIIWNFGHIVVSTPILCYVRSGVWKDSSKIKFAATYAKGTKPTHEIGEAEVKELKDLALSSIQQLEEDYKAGKLSLDSPFETSTYTAEVKSIEDIIIMTAGHDNIHLGYAMAQNRIINNNI